MAKARYRIDILWPDGKSSGQTQCDAQELRTWLESVISHVESGPRKPEQVIIERMS